MRLRGRGPAPPPPPSRSPRRARRRGASRAEARSSRSPSRCAPRAAGARRAGRPERPRRGRRPRRGGVRRLRRARHRRQRRRRHDPNAFLDTDVAYLEEAFHCNVSTAHALSVAAVPLMLKGPRDDAQRSIVNISSMIGRASGRGYLAYGTAKAALARWTGWPPATSPPSSGSTASTGGSVMTSALEFGRRGAGDEGATGNAKRRWAGSARPRTSRRPSSACRRGPADPAPARSSRSARMHPGAEPIDLNLPDLTSWVGTVAPTPTTGPRGVARLRCALKAERARGPWPRASTGSRCRCMDGLRAVNVYAIQTGGGLGLVDGGWAIGGKPGRCC